MIGLEPKMRARRDTYPDRRMSLAVLARDAALDRVARTRRWVIGATAALTAGFAGLVSVAAPGKSLGSARKTASGSGGLASTSTGSAALRMPPPAGAAQLGLQGPDQAPEPAAPPAQSSPAASQPAPAPAAPAPSSGGVVSGGS